MVQKTDLREVRFCVVNQIRVLFSNDAYTLLVVAVAFKFNNATLESEKGVVRADTNVLTGMHVSASLANDDVACENCLAVGFLNAKSLCAAIASVHLIMNVNAPNRFTGIDDEHGHCGKRGADDVLSELGIACMTFLMKPVKNAVSFVKNHFCHRN